jgi:16S rRNA (cytosine1402-N4)-methyltransferase
MSTYHTPIMVPEVLEGLGVETGKIYLDATVGGGGHATAIVARGGQVIGLDQDPEALAETKKHLSNATLIHGNFRQLSEKMAELGIDKLDGILFDLGVSSHQLDDPRRGFGFQAEVLDMRMDQTEEALSAQQFLAQLGKHDMEVLFRELGEERYARRFAEAIDCYRQECPIASAQQLREIIWQASPPAYRRGSIHPATRVFQALRMAINAELPSLEAALPQAAALLNSGGRLVVMSFHSLEDRIVKRFMVNSSNLGMLTPKPIMATDAELAINPRARSAKLRIAQMH